MVDSEPQSQHILGHRMTAWSFSPDDLAGFVFTTSTGRPLDQVNVTTSFQRCLRRLGLPKRRFHDLRHTFATLAIEAGEPLKAVSRALGHTSLATTADICAHWTPAMQERLVQRMDAVLGA